MKLVFVHGWSVTSKKTYGDLPQVLQSSAPSELELEIENIYLGEYISFHDEVNLSDIARAFECARKEKLGDENFACITHSTGGPVIRFWLDLFFKEKLSGCPLSHLVMLAPANHGSSLAVLGKEKLYRIKSLAEGIEPGVGVLNWLQLGSSAQWELNNSWMNYSYGENSFFPFVLSGEKIDKHFYDFINSYLCEEGSDGVVRLCGANMNYKQLTLHQESDSTLRLQNSIESSPKCAFEVIPNASHSGDKYGIMASVKKRRVVKPVVHSIIESLLVKNTQEYNQLKQKMQQRTQSAQKQQRYIMFVFDVEDNYGNNIKDYDMILLAGEDYEPHKLPKGFFVDRQKNKMSGNLVYYLNYDKLKNIKDGKIGIWILARPNKGFSHYLAAEFRSDSLDIKELLQPNQTVMIKVVLNRQISKNTFVLDTVNKAKEDFNNRKVGDEFINSVL